MVFFHHQIDFLIALFILIPRIEKIEGSGPIYPISFLKISKMFLRILWTLFTTVIDLSNEVIAKIINLILNVKNTGVV